MYTNASDSYWKIRQKSNKAEKAPLQKGAAIFSAILAASFFLWVGRIYHDRDSGGTAALERPTAAAGHFALCESRVDSHGDCASICRAERNSIARKTMHHACLHGCKTAHAAAVTIGCRGGSEEDAFHQIGGAVAYQQCSKYQGATPRPDVFATCRKYHRAGTKQGVQSGGREILSVLDEEWALIQSRQ